MPTEEDGEHIDSRKSLIGYLCVMSVPTTSVDAGHFFPIFLHSFTPYCDIGPASEDISCLFQVCPFAMFLSPFEIMLTETLLQSTLEQDKAGQGI
ncbi:hypothetical protein THAOC_29269 [Thalassiosira oceanica]|uniref:Uncharacterized protein n=1 Tax=Thalassiosira oceanica TaxID=159749 RepID=K0RCW6_THAOC|nr:hypothetical protein THAOC_29269 [Thalassiosira oceanica]|eukprot:EJK51548.1 hypothetical protein THAOC_29269 [Thalassiosira oceanica]